MDFLFFYSYKIKTDFWKKTLSNYKPQISIFFSIMLYINEAYGKVTK
jgi:hypothetical protein